MVDPRPLKHLQTLRFQCEPHPRRVRCQHDVTAASLAFDVSKLDQWEVLFDHAEALGMSLQAFVGLGLTVAGLLSCSAVLGDPREGRPAARQGTGHPVAREGRPAARQGTRPLVSATHPVAQLTPSN